jgi:hypothetical protein
VPRRFTVPEADAEIPRLTMLLERLQRCALELDAARRAEAAGRGTSVEALSPGLLARARPAARALMEELSGLVQEIERSGARLKDVALGLVDFPAELEGELVELCWQFGEARVAFWHREGEGFAGRRPLADVADTRVLQ